MVSGETGTRKGIRLIFNDDSGIDEPVRRQQAFCCGGDIPLSGPDVVENQAIPWELNLIKQIETIRTNTHLLRRLAEVRAEGKTVGLVPTMGALHEGHLSLVRASMASTDVTVVTIFVNPTQFGPDEDLDQYPRPLESDIAKLNELGVEIVFTPSQDEVYPARLSTFVKPPAVSLKLEGEFRPTHFEGVCTVVLKLFNLTRADVAFFGQKDYQQACVLQDMVADLNVPIRVRICPIVREPDGLAMSSRNMYFNEQERTIALSLSRVLADLKQNIAGGQRDCRRLMNRMHDLLNDGGVTRVDYAVIADPKTFVIQQQVELPAVALIAAVVGKTRLIDNELITEKSIENRNS